MGRLSLRWRLAAVLGVLLVTAGIALLALSYTLVTTSLRQPLGSARTEAPSRSAGAGAQSPTAGAGAPSRSVELETAQQTLLDRTRDQLVKQYAVVLLGLLVVAVVVGWLLAGRLLAPVRRITEVARRVRPGHLAERVRLDRTSEDELRELGSTFDAMLARLDAVFQAQEHFVANASHELRTPLTAMRAEIEVLVADPDAAAADLAASTLVLRRQLARCEEQIAALLALASCQPELLRRGPLDLMTLAVDALDQAAGRVEGRRLRTERDLAPAPVQADRRLLALAVANIISNAIEHNRPGGSLSLTTARVRGRATLRVANEGPVIAPAELAELTQPFRRGPHSGGASGHGLGLAIVAAVVEAHDGTLRLVARPQGGLVVEVGLASERSTLEALRCAGADPREVPAAPATHSSTGTRHEG